MLTLYFNYIQIFFNLGQCISLVKCKCTRNNEILISECEIWVITPSLFAHRRRHISAVLNVRGMVHQTDRQEILAVVRDLENSDSSINLPRERALFSEIAVAKDMSCLGLVLIRFGLTVSSWVASARPHRNHSRRSWNEKHKEGRPQSKRFAEN